MGGAAAALAAAAAAPNAASLPLISSTRAWPLALQVQHEMQVAFLQEFYQVRQRHAPLAGPLGALLGGRARGPACAVACPTLVLSVQCLTAQQQP